MKWTVQTGDGRRRVDSDDSNKGCGYGLVRFVRFLYTYQIQKGDVVKYRKGMWGAIMLAPVTSSCCLIHI